MQRHTCMTCESLVIYAEKFAWSKLYFVETWWFGKWRIQSKWVKGAKRRNRDESMWWEAILECPCMYFGSDDVVSCLRADTACLKMDMCVYAEAAHPQMDVKIVASLRTERHLVETLQGRTHSWTELVKVKCCRMCVPCLLHGNAKASFHNVLCGLSSARNQIW